MRSCEPRRNWRAPIVRAWVWLATGVGCIIAGITVDQPWTTIFGCLSAGLAMASIGLDDG